MAVHQSSFVAKTPGRGTTNVTAEVQSIADASGIKTGICTVFIQHTSASLLITENADPDVRIDLETWMKNAVRDGDPEFVHDAEGPDDMSAHVRTVLTDTTITVPVRNGKLALGTWQGVYVWEHRTSPHERRLVVTILGE
ncbi:MAG: secondary thiamine-phosphate synthase enzyme YjbQ [Myxococcota bacterium]